LCPTRVRAIHKVFFVAVCVLPFQQAPAPPERPLPLVSQPLKRARPPAARERDTTSGGRPPPLRFNRSTTKESARRPATRRRSGPPSRAGRDMKCGGRQAGLRQGYSEGVRPAPGRPKAACGPPGGQGVTRSARPWGFTRLLCATTPRRPRTPSGPSSRCASTGNARADWSHCGRTSAPASPPPARAGPA